MLGGGVALSGGVAMWQGGRLAGWRGDRVAGWPGGRVAGRPCGWVARGVCTHVAGWLSLCPPPCAPTPSLSIYTKVERQRGGRLGAIRLPGER